MANNIALAKTFVPILDEIYKLASLTSKLDGAAELARQGANANELIVPMLSMQGLGDYSRNDGYVKGDVTMTNETVKCNYDRGRKFYVDALDNEETAKLAFSRLSGEFIRTKVVPELDGLVKDLGLEEGGRAQQHLVKNVARRITKYVPKRTYSSIENAIAQGQEPANGRIVIRGPQVKYLYFGKVMAGRKPKHVTNKDIRYTTTFNRLAGPFWLERLMAAEKDRIIEDERRNILGGP